MQIISSELYLLFLSLHETTAKTIKMFNTHLRKFQKVRSLFFIKCFILEKKTLVLDIDETLVYATTNRSELRLVDETIFIKMTKFGGTVKAYLSYRPFLFEVLDALRNHFELILYTCGTAAYAAAFAESVEKNGGKKYFDHVLSL
jgi:NLI interacting factor-like phosphatase